MFNPLGAISALGAGAMSGFPTGQSAFAKYTELKATQAAQRALQGIGGLSPMGGTDPTGGATASYSPPTDTDSQDPLLPPQVPPQTADGVLPAPLNGGLAQQPPQMAGGLQTPFGASSPQMPTFLQGGGDPGASPVRTAMLPGGGPGGPGGFAPMGNVQPAPGQTTQLPPIDVGAGGQPGANGQQAAPPPEPLSPAEQERNRRGVQRYAETGEGFLTFQDLVKRIDQANPGASPEVKYRALQKAMPLLNQQGQGRLTKVQADLEKARLAREKFDLAKQKEDRVKGQTEQRLRQQSPYVQSEKKARTDLQGQLTRKESRSQTLVKHFDKLIEFSQKVAITGSPPIDTWLNNVAAATGNKDAILYTAQLNNLRSEVGAILGNSPSGIMTEGMRHEVADFILKGVMGPQVLEGLKKLYAWDAQTQKEVFEKQIDEIDEDIDQFMKTGQRPARRAAPAPAPTAAPAAAPAAAQDPFGIR